MFYSTVASCVRTLRKVRTETYLSMIPHTLKNVTLFIAYLDNCVGLWKYSICTFIGELSEMCADMYQFYLSCSVSLYVCVCVCVTFYTVDVSLQRSVLFRTDSSTRLHGDASTAVTSSPESFVSAQDEVSGADCGCDKLKAHFTVKRLLPYC
jgi:hypothetical protein